MTAKRERLRKHTVVLTGNWLADAQVHLARAEGQLKIHPRASVDFSQKAIEFSAKALLCAAGFEPPKQHDISDRLDRAVRNLEGEDVLVSQGKATITRIARMNKVSAPLHTISEYGLFGVPAASILEDHDAQTWLDYARQAVSRAGQFLFFLERKRLRYTAVDGEG